MNQQVQNPDDTATEAEELRFEAALEDLQQTPWQPRQGAGTRIVAWLILIVIAICIAGMTVLLVLPLFQ